MKFRKYIGIFKMVLRVAPLAAKYHSWLLFSRNRKVSQSISEHNSYCNLKESNTVYRDYRKVDKQIDRIIDILPFRKTCLIRTLVKAEYFKLYMDVYLPINLGLVYHDNELAAHSWLENDKDGMTERKFIKVN